MKRLLSSLFAGCLLLASVGTASAAAIYVPPFEGQQKVGSQGIPYISGGVGITGRTQMERLDRGYTLKLVLDVKSGDYISAAKVKIRNANGKVLVDAVSGGPWFAAKLAPGTYRVTAEFNGRQQGQTVRVGHHSRRIVLTFS